VKFIYFGISYDNPCSPLSFSLLSAPCSPLQAHVLATSPFLVHKKGLCMWISAYFFAENQFFGNPPHLWWIGDFAHMYLTRIQTRIWSLASHIYLRKWFFWPPKHCCPSQAQWKKTFCLTLNIMVSQTVRNESVRFGGHVGIQVSYKILQLEVLKDSPFLVTSPCFQ
jgi:hypothetical protein